MRLLLDENVTHNLRYEIVGHDCVTAAYQGWKGKKNGELLRLAAEAGFDALVTSDTNLPFQQNTENLPLAIVVVRAPSNDLEDLLPLIPALLEALKKLPPRTITVVE